jgi:formate hydrogenlyase subunit 6/NADH:ubiquinone oxidoreductase subunit I
VQLLKDYLTIKHLFTRKVTIQYPEQIREMVPYIEDNINFKGTNKAEELYSCMTVVPYHALLKQSL